MRILSFVVSLVLAAAAAGAAAAHAQTPDELSHRAPRFLVASAPSKAPRPLNVAQTPALRRRISLDLRDVTLAEGLAAVSKEAGLHLMYSKDVVPLEQRVTLEAKAITVAAALTELLLDANVDVLFSATGQAVLVRRMEKGETLPQVGTVVGRVTDSERGEKVAGAEVFLEGTRWRTASDANGWYRLAEVDTGTYTLAARRLGYAKQSQAVTVVAGQVDTVNVALEPVATRLDELVTTATGPQRRLAIANAATVLRADSIVRTQPIKNVTDLLETRVPGLAALPTTGAPGDPTRLRLRGSSSILRSNDPIVIVDGVRIREGYSSSLANPDVPAPSPLDRIDPNSIETIEVLNGPSAATLYGADAANGVIVIMTKRGRPGPARWDIALTHGRSSTPGRFPEVYFGFGGEDVGCSPVGSDMAGSRSLCVLDSVISYQVLNDPELTVLGQGHRSSLSGTVSGGQSAITYAVTGSYVDEVGALKLPQYEADRFRTMFGRQPEDWMERPHHLRTWSMTSNFTFKPARSAGITFKMSLAGDEQNRSNLEQQLGVLRGAYVDKTTGLIYRDGVTNPPTPSLVPDFYRRTTNRALALTTGVNVAWQPFERFTFRADAGLNTDLRRDESLLPVGLRIGIDSTGFLRTGQRTASMGTLNVGANYGVPLGLGFRLDAAVGLNFTSRSTVDLNREVANPTGGASTTGPAEQVTDHLTSYGWYVEPRIGNQRFHLSTGLRLDGGSSYNARGSDGLSNPLQGFKLPKLGVSWLISDEPFFPVKDSRILNWLKIRAAYGQAGVQPGPTDRLRLFTAGGTENLDGQDRPAADLASLGNTQLRPERSTEIEGGFDAELFNGWLLVDLTGYRKTKNDAHLSVPVAPSVYGTSSVLINIGVVRNTGFHLTLGTNLLRTERLQWNTQLQVSHNRNVVVSLAPGLDAFGLGPNSPQRIVTGYPLFGYWERPILGYADANGNDVLERSEILLGDSLAFLGAPEPTYTAALHSTAGLFRGALTVSASFDYQDGFAQRNAAPGGALARAQWDPSAPLAHQALVVAQQGGLDGSPSSSYGLFQTVSTLRFHSLSVGWRLPMGVVRWVGAQSGHLHMQGANLGLFTNYRGKDPLVNSLATGNAVLDAGALPLPREWQVRLNLSY